MRLLASAIVVLAGAICFGLSATGPSTGTGYAGEAQAMGLFILLAGGVCFMIEFVRTWRRSGAHED